MGLCMNERAMGVLAVIFRIETSKTTSKSLPQADTWCDPAHAGFGGSQCRRFSIYPVRFKRRGIEMRHDFSSHCELRVRFRFSWMMNLSAAEG